MYDIDMLEGALRSKVRHIDALESQRDQLREALEKIESMDESLVYDMRAIAGAALRATEEGG